MKKTILGLTVVAAVFVVSCSKSECKCDNKGNAAAKTLIDAALSAGAKDNETSCNALKTSLSSGAAIFYGNSGANCTWG